MEKHNNEINYLKIGSDQECKEISDQKCKEILLQSSGTDSSDSDLLNDVEPWLTALFQSERLNILIGSGLTIAQEKICKPDSNTSNTMMKDVKLTTFNTAISKASKAIAKNNDRKKTNIEDQINAITTLLNGLEIYKEGLGEPANLKQEIKVLKQELKTILNDFVKNILVTEKTILDYFIEMKEKKEKTISNYLIPFLMSFATRTSSKERPHIFTTNYDRCIEWGADLTGLRLIDRFVGSMEPVFRSSRLNIDMHYNPPGIRGEPRYLEGVMYFTKLHGSLDWRYKKRYKNDQVRKIALPFGDTTQYEISAKEQCLIYPNFAKDQQANGYPYTELFRDFATAVCRPNTTLVTYGYGFGDKHINRVIEDMLTIPSTHLIIISYMINEDAIAKFCKDHFEQVSILMGNVLGNLENLVKYFLPKSSINSKLNKMYDIQRKKVVYQQPENSDQELKEFDDDSH